MTRPAGSCIAAWPSVILSIALRRELPEALKPRTVAITTGPSTLIEADKAA
jgi:molecular chaperone IbpA